MTNEMPKLPPSRPRSRHTRNVIWSLASVVAVLVLADPFGMHEIDQRIQQLVGLGLGSGESQAQTQAQTQTQLWTCPMHPQIIRNEPGSCPICKMDLVPVKSMSADETPSEGAPPVSTQERSTNAMTDTPAGAQKVGELWTCGMHPQVLQKEPGSCPICKMDLTPVSIEGTASTEAAANAAGPAILVSPSVVQKMNVRTEIVQREDLRRQIRTVGYLEYDPNRVVSVTTKFSGFVEKTYANYLGQTIRKGEPLFEIYAPELVQTVRELGSAQRYAEKLASAPPETRQRAEALVDAARARLAYWDVSAEEIDSRSEANLRTFAVRAPATGVITRRIEGLDGMAVQPGMELLQIADLSRLWLTVEVFEDQLPWITEGSPVSVSMDYFPGQELHGTVRFVEPMVSMKTRSVRVSLDVPNSDGKLHAGMFATAIFEPVIATAAVVVSGQAVLRTGVRDVVVVDAGEGRFEPRTVVLGPDANGRVQVLEGLSAGERIVTSAQFLIDSESNLQAAIQRMIAAQAPGQSPAPSPGHAH